MRCARTRSTDETDLFRTASAISVALMNTQGLPESEEAPAGARYGEVGGVCRHPAERTTNKITRQILGKKYRGEEVLQRFG